MDAFQKPLEELAEFQEIADSLKKGRAGVRQITGCIESQKAHIVHGLGRVFGHCRK